MYQAGQALDAAVQDKKSVINQRYAKPNCKQSQMRAAIHSGIDFDITLCMCMKIFTLIFSLLFSQIAIADDTAVFGAIYVDTINSLNIKGGILLKNNDAITPDPGSHYYGSFKYTDLELGLEGSKISLGIGQFIGHGFDRIGFSYAHLRSQDMTGIEWVASQMGGSFKLGYYFGLNKTPNRFLLGFGFGF